MNKDVEWISVKNGLPKKGVYFVKGINDGVVFQAKRKLIGNKWFGGVRPFSDSEIVTHYRNLS